MQQLHNLITKSWEAEMKNIIMAKSLNWMVKKAYQVGGGHICQFLQKLNKLVSKVFQCCSILLSQNFCKFFKLYFSDTCHVIKGTDGVFFPPYVDKNYPIWLYVPDSCRSVFANFEDEVSIKAISAWRFRANKNLINFTHHENLCFCPNFRKCAKADETGM